MKVNIFLTAAAAVAFACTAPATASTVVTTACVSVSDPAGCLFNGNINGNTNPTNVNSHKNAEAAYNAIRSPAITLNYITQSDAGNFDDFGSITGGSGSSGTWSLPRWLVEFVAVKAGPNFVLYKLATPASSGSWDTFDIPFNNNPRELSHLAFFGSEVPEPATWAMMIGGFGLIGAASRRRRRASVTFA